jgi:hypothetical protein
MALRRRNERAGKRIIVDLALDAQPRMNSERQLGGDLSRQVDYGIKILFIVEGIDDPSNRRTKDSSPVPLLNRPVALTCR